MTKVQLCYDLQVLYIGYLQEFYFVRLKQNIMMCLVLNNMFLLQ